MSRSGDRGSGGTNLCRMTAQQAFLRLRGERRLRRRGHLIAQARQLTPSANNQEVEGTSRSPHNGNRRRSHVSGNVIALRLSAQQRRKSKERKHNLWTALLRCSQSGS